jgi:hypothetical protein
LGSLLSCWISKKIYYKVITKKEKTEKDVADATEELKQNRKEDRIRKYTRGMKQSKSFIAERFSRRVPYD